MILVVLLIALFLVHVIFDIPYYAIFLGIIALIAIWSGIYVLINRYYKSIADTVVKAKLIEEINVYKRETECQGYSIGNDGDLHHHYKYVKKYDHKEYVFRVTYKDGSEALLKCKEGSTLYGELWRKASKYYS